MASKTTWLLIGAIAPITWGSTYFVTRHSLPMDAPLWGAIIRGLPAGLVLLAMSRRVPRGSWWWKSVVLGTLNTGAFFVLVYAAGQLLPTSIASMIMSLSPIVMMGLAWLMLSERPAAPMVIGGLIGVGGVALLLGADAGAVNALGVIASVVAMLMSAAGFVLTKRWGRGGNVIASTSWQLVAGALVIVPFAVVFEGMPPTLDAESAIGFAYLTLIATAVAYLAWFGALAHLPAGSVGLVGLLNPVTGVLLGLALGGETLGGWQWVGLALVLGGLLLGQLAPGPRTRERVTSRSRVLHYLCQACQTSRFRPSPSRPRG